MARSTQFDCKLRLLDFSLEVKELIIFIITNPMQPFYCPQRNTDDSYTYRQEIEVQIMKVITIGLPFNPNHRLIIRTASRLLRLNLLQCSLITWLLRKSYEKREDLRMFCKQLTVFPEARDNKELLVLLLNGFYAKSFLCNFIEPSIDLEIAALVPNFRNIYRQWSPAQVLRELTLAQVSSMFQKWTSPQTKPKKDYNSMVCKILQLSKSYNIGANDHPHPPRKEHSSNNSYNQIQELEEAEPGAYSHHLGFEDEPHLHFQYLDENPFDYNQNQQFVIRQRKSSERRYPVRASLERNQRSHLFEQNSSQNIDRSGRGKKGEYKGAKKSRDSSLLNDN